VNSFASISAVVSAARQGQIAFWCIGALFLAAAVIYAIAGHTPWPYWLTLSGSILAWAASGYVQRSQRPANIILNSLLVTAAALSVTGVIGLLATHH